MHDFVASAMLCSMAYYTNTNFSTTYTDCALKLQERCACGFVQALAQDQLRALRQMCEAAFGDQAPCVEVYDGDTIRVQ